MFTFNYKRIFGASWVGDHGTLTADSVADARAMIFEKLQVSDPHENKWVEKTESIPVVFVLFLTKDRGVGDERIELWQEPSLFDKEVS